MCYKKSMPFWVHTCAGFEKCCCYWYANNARTKFIFAQLVLSFHMSSLLGRERQFIIDILAAAKMMALWIWLCVQVLLFNATIALKKRGKCFETSHLPFNYYIYQNRHYNWPAHQNETPLVYISRWHNPTVYLVYRFYFGTRHVGLEGGVWKKRSNNFHTSSTVAQNSPWLSRLSSSCIYYYWYSRKVKEFLFHHGG